MEFSKSLQKVIQELIELGLTERKIANKLKNLRDEISIEKLSSNNDKKYNIYINSFLFGGKLFINNPSNQLLGLIKSMKTMYGSECVYYILSNITYDKYFNNQIHDKNDSEKSNWLMFLLGQYANSYIEDYISINSKKSEPEPDCIYEEEEAFNGQ